MPSVDWTHTNQLTFVQIGPDLTLYLSPRQLAHLHSKLSDAVIDRAEFDGTLQEALYG